MFVYIETNYAFVGFKLPYEFFSSIYLLQQHFIYPGHINWFIYFLITNWNWHFLSFTGKKLQRFLYFFLEKIETSYIFPLHKLSKIICHNNRLHISLLANHIVSFHSPQNILHKLSMMWLNNVNTYISFVLLNIQFVLHLSAQTFEIVSAIAN